MAMRGICACKPAGNSQAVSLTLPDLYVGETKSIVVELAVAAPLATGPLLRLTLDYLPAIAGATPPCGFQPGFLQGLPGRCRDHFLQLNHEKPGLPAARAGAGLAGSVCRQEVDKKQSSCTAAPTRTCPCGLQRLDPVRPAPLKFWSVR